MMFSQVSARLAQYHSGTAVRMWAQASVALAHVEMQLDSKV
jgi:hypothetical protein